MILSIHTRIIIASCEIFFGAGTWKSERDMWTKKHLLEEKKSIQNIVWWLCDDRWLFSTLTESEKKPVEIFDEMIGKQKIEKKGEKGRERERIFKNEYQKKVGE